MNDVKTEPDFCYDPHEWEYTLGWDERDVLLDDYPWNLVHEVATLIKGPTKFAVWISTESDHRLEWFNARADAEAALASALEADVALAAAPEPTP